MRRNDVLHFSFASVHPSIHGSTALCWVFHPRFYSPLLGLPSMVLQPFVGPSIHGSTALCWVLAAFSVSWSYTQSVGPLGWVISPSQGRYLHTGQPKHRINAYTDIHASNGTRTHDPSVLASEDSSCPWQRGHCDRRNFATTGINLL
jgi:hypothetical protein